MLVEKAFPLVTIYIFLSGICLSQDKFKELREILAKSKESAVFHYKLEWDTLNDFYYPEEFFNPKHNYLWHKNELKVQLDGTGKILVLDTNFIPHRIDSTIFDGYNFGAFNFVYNDTIFSLGGYGFWQFNGMLRYYNERQHGWSLIQSNKSIPLRLWFNGQVYLDSKNRKLYVAFRKPREGLNEAAVKPDTHVYVECLDLKTKQWIEKNYIVNEGVMTEWDWAHKPLFNSEIGLITFNRDELDVFDFGNNRWGKVRMEKAKGIMDEWYMSKELIMLATGNQLHFVNPKNGYVNSFPIQNEDIEWEEKSLMSTDLYPVIEKSKTTIILIISVLISFAGGYFLKKRKLNLSLKIESLPINEIDEEEQQQSKEIKKSFRDTLTETEKSLLDLLVKNGKDGKMTSVHQVNEVLGLSRKDTKFQNNVRSSTFQMINKKFIVFSGLADPLIVKERTEFDKRFYEYAILPKYLQKIK